MDVEEYNRRIAMINDELSEIARRTVDQAWANSANYSNTQFVELMKRHAKLTRLSSELTDWMMAQLEME